jgi:hypothetical protein
MPHAPTAVGLEDIHIHDLRHTGNQFTADAGAHADGTSSG